jgi:hypothetical protein
VKNHGDDAAHQRRGLQSSSGGSSALAALLKWLILIIGACWLIDKYFNPKDPAAAAPCAQGGQCVGLTKAKVKAEASTNSAEVGTIQCVCLLSPRSRACTLVARAFADSKADWRVVAATLHRSPQEMVTFLEFKVTKNKSQRAKIQTFDTSGQPSTTGWVSMAVKRDVSR